MIIFLLMDKWDKFNLFFFKKFIVFSHFNCVYYILFFNFEYKNEKKEIYKKISGYTIIRYSRWYLNSWHDLRINNL